MRRHLYWSLRRELWENRSVLVAPLVVAAIALAAFVYTSLRHLPERIAGLPALEPAKQLAAVVMPYNMAASAVLFTGFVVGIFYCLDALHAERRDRSILFWKSMPVSDRVTIASKAAVPMAVQPLFGFAVALAAQLAMLLVSTLILITKGVSPAAQWNVLPLAQLSAIMFYGLVVHVLWYAPIYALLLLVSAWVRRAPFMWVVLPLLATIIAERLAFGSGYFAALLGYRITGAMNEAFVPGAAKGLVTQFSQLDPMRFLSTPGLWLGVAFAALCLAGAVQVRRRREPI